MKANEEPVRPPNDKREEGLGFEEKDEEKMMKDIMDILLKVQKLRV